jgi:hypothetical protein
MQRGTDHTSVDGFVINDAEVGKFLQRCKYRFASARAREERSESTLNHRMLNSITSTQVTQTRTGNDLLKLTNDLHDFARQVNEQERRLQERAKLNQGQSKFNNKLLEATVNKMRTTLSLSQTAPASLQAAQDGITQLKAKVGHLEYQIKLKHNTIERRYDRVG